MKGDVMRTCVPIGHSWRLPLLCALFFGLTLPASAQLPVQVQSATTPAQTHSVNDVDFVHSTTPKWIFTITMSTEGQSIVNAIMLMRIDISLATGEELPGIVGLQTAPFSIPGQRTITNFDLKDPAFARNYVVNEAHKRRLEEIALPSGLLPAGMYRFSLEVRPDDGREPTRHEFQLELTNPSSIDLLFPNTGESLVTEFPVFQWRGDAPEWRLSIFQRLPGQTSNEEAASGVPYFTAVTREQLYQYPGTGSRLLESNQTYVWYVEGLPVEAGGIQRPFRSEIRSFTLVRSGSGDDTQTTNEFLDELERVLGPDYKHLIDELRTSQVTSSAIQLNGSTISRAEAITILQQLRDIPGTISSVVLE